MPPQAKDPFGALPLLSNFFQPCKIIHYRMPCKILSLDGGGSWAILEAMALGKLYGYDVPGQNILAHFDFAAANSGGSIVLAGLALNFSPRQLINCLNSEQERKTIFVKNFISLVGLERYQTPAKLQGLRAALSAFGGNPDQLFNLISLPGPNPPATCRLLIAAFNYERLRAEFFRSDTNSPAATSLGSPQPTLAEAVHASTNAPVKYFDAPAQFATPAFAGCRYWDGAMGGFNNPVMAAITEALAYGYAPSDLRVLSIGAGSVFLPLPALPLPPPGSAGQNSLCVPIETSGVYRDVGLVTTVIIDDPPDQASFMAHLLVSGAGALSQNTAAPVTNGNLVRLNPWIQPVRGPAGWSVPSLIAHAPDPTMAPPNSVPASYGNDTDAFAALVGLDMDAIDQSEVDLISTLGRAWIAGDVPNQCIRATRDLEPLIGHSSFTAAVAQATALGLA